MEDEVEIGLRERWTEELIEACANNKSKCLDDSFGIRIYYILLPPF
jgi:hypothetical protein